MIVKPFTEGNAIERLTALLASHAGRSKSIETEIRKVRSGLKGERDAAHYIDQTLSGSSNYAVIHGLRLVTPHGVAQIDHIIISRLMMVFILETKHFRDGLKITEEGEFLRLSRYDRRFHGMESPLMQSERHETLLGHFLRANPIFPTRLGIRMSPQIRSLVLVNPQAILERPQKFDTSRVVKADQFFGAIQKDMDKVGVLGSLGMMAQVVSSSTVREIASTLAAHDQPIEIDFAGKLGLRVSVPTMPSDASAPGSETIPAAAMSSTPVPECVSEHTPATSSPSCKSCASGNGEIRFGKFGYYWKCLACDANTKLTLPGPGKLRKDGPRFFYNQEGQSEALFHVNGTSSA